MASNTEITFISKAPNLAINALLDGEGAIVTGGYAEWEVISRPRRLGVTHWVGRSPFTMDLAIIFDGHKAFESVETRCTNLEHLALPDDKTGIPPTVSIIKRGPSGDVPHPTVPHSDIKEWVVTGIDWGDNIRDINGHRTRQHAVVKLLRYVAVDKIQVTAAQNARAKAGTGVRIVNVRKGDTLASIAARELGNSKRWNEIAKLNPPLRDPNALIKIKTVKVPPK